MVWAYNRAEPEQLDLREEKKYNVEKAKGNLGRARGEEMVFCQDFRSDKKLGRLNTRIS